MYRNGLSKDERSRIEKPEIQIIPFLSPRGAQFRHELLTKILPCHQITDSFHNFSYYLQEHTKSLLLECVASKLKHSELTKYGAGIKSSSHRILLQTIPGGELYRERLVRAVAREMQVPLLRLDLDHGCDHQEKDHDYGQRFHPRLPYDQSQTDDKTYNKGDRVQYIGRNIPFKEVNNRTLSYGQRGEVYEVKCDTVAVVFNVRGLKPNKAEADEKNKEILGKSILVWLHANDVVKDEEVRKHDCYIAMEVLCEVLESQQPMIVFFADSFLWPPLEQSNDTFLKMVENVFDQLPEGVVMICPDNNREVGLETEKACPVPSSLPVPMKGEYPKSLKKYLDTIPHSNSKSKLHKLFSNVICIKPPKDEDLVETFIQQIQEDRLTFISEANLKTMHKVLKDHNLSCMNLEHPIIEDMILKRNKVEMIVGWALNHYLSLGAICSVNEDRLHIPLDSIKLAISRFMEEENCSFIPNMKPKALQDLSYLVHGSKQVDSAIVLSEDIDVKIDDVGILENVKKVLYETVIHPIRRPELFTHGNILGVGILLFGPPGTGKTLVAKALAKESGAKFIHITAENITSMSVGTLFTCASKLAPVIIYFDEVDSFHRDGPRDHFNDDKLYKFMAAWDHWKSKESKRILIIGATNRPYDIDEAVIRQMPRRIYVGLPDLENRSKILKGLLNKTNLEPEFSFEQVAEATEGYSGSDLKNLCSAAAYGSIEEFLEQESKGEASDGVPALRPLTVNDYIQSTSKVRPSALLNASSTMKLKEWKEQFGEGESQSLQI